MLAHCAAMQPCARNKGTQSPCLFSRENGRREKRTQSKGTHKKVSISNVSRNKEQKEKIILPSPSSSLKRKNSEE